MESVSFLPGSDAEIIEKLMAMVAMLEGKIEGQRVELANGAEGGRRLAEVVKIWWKDHKYDTAGEYGDYNVYDEEPDFVTKAKEIIGDWEA